MDIDDLLTGIEQLRLFESGENNINLLARITNILLLKEKDKRIDNYDKNIMDIIDNVEKLLNKEYRKLYDSIWNILYEKGVSDQMDSVVKICTSVDEVGRYKTNNSKIVYFDSMGYYVLFEDINIMMQVISNFPGDNLKPSNQSNEINVNNKRSKITPENNETSCSVLMDTNNFIKSNSPYDRSYQSYYDDYNSIVLYGMSIRKFAKVVMNHGWKTVRRSDGMYWKYIDESRNKNMETYKTGGKIYLLREREFINKDEPVYKIGKTRLEGLKRFNGYPKGSELLLNMECTDCDVHETILIKLFDQLFINRKDIGREYYEGDMKQMKKKIIDIISK